MELKPINQLQGAHPQEINRQIRVRLDLIKQMVGTLYPSILGNEIAVLGRQYQELTGRYDHD